MSTPDEKIEALTQELSSIHGVIVSKDDPVMITYSLNERLIKENKVAHNDLIENFKSHMEVISDKWSIEAKNHSDRILNSSIVSSKDEVARVMGEQSTVIVEQWKNELSTGFSQVHKTIESARHTAILNIIASFITLISAGIVLYVFLTM